MGLKQSFFEEQVADMVLRKPVLVSSDTPVRVVTACMREQGVGCAIVVDEAERPVGTFTESTLVGLLLDDPGKLGESVERHLSTSWVQVNESATVAHMLEVMQRAHARFVVVTDRHGKVAGLCGLRGLMQFVADHFPREVLVQRIGAKPCIYEREGA